MCGSPTDDVPLARVEGGDPVINFLVPLVPAKESCRVFDKKSDICRLTVIVCRRKEGLVGDGDR